MSEDVWRPLGIDTEDAIARYDALHDGVPPWLMAPFWTWVEDALTVYRSYPDRSGREAMVDTILAEQMCQILQVPLPNLRGYRVGHDSGRKQMASALATFKSYADPLQVADYLLAHDGHAKPEDLDDLLERGKSAWKVATRSGKPGLARRVPVGVQAASDSVMAHAGRAGKRLAKAWEALYGVNPNASEAYRLAILAVEDAAVPKVSPNNTRATLGTVLSQMESQKDWRLPMDREHANAPSGEVLVGMMRMLHYGQHDRHGGQPSAPGNVSTDEATVAVSIAVTLVQWFDAALVERLP